MAEAAAGAWSSSPSERKTGVILLNIGTPKSLEVKDVREYLGLFLGDDRVLEIKPAFVKALVLQLILATRPKDSAEAYGSIWDPERGSPLLYHSEDLIEGLTQKLGPKFRFKIGFMYAEPFVSQAIDELQAEGIDDILLMPAFPHYASSTTGTCLETAYRHASSKYNTPFLRAAPPYFDDPRYLAAMRQKIVDTVGVGAKDVDYLLFSFHGLPEVQCSKTDDTGSVCMAIPDCCGEIVKENRNCYRAQCFETARLLAKEVGVDKDRWSVSFQSRLTLRDTIQWVRPYTDERFKELAQAGVRRLGVVAPSFTADCVETLEELGITGQEQFQEGGGEELVVVPCLNSSSEWVDSFAAIIQDQVTQRA